MSKAALHDTDFYAWTRQQAALLRRLAADRSNAELDLEHLAKEIDDLGDNTLAVIEGLIVQVMIHLLKLEFSPAPGLRAGWRKEVAAWRATIRRRRRRAPSVVNHIELDWLYENDVLNGATLALADDGVRGGDLPRSCPYCLDQVLGAFIPENRHGIPAEGRGDPAAGQPR